MLTRLNPQTLLQLRIELRYTDPVVWRVVRVPDTITLVKLHAVIQAVMGWWDCHLHEFEIGGLRYGIPDPAWDLGPELINEARKKLLKVLGNRRRFAIALRGKQHCPLASLDAPSGGVTYAEGAGDFLYGADIDRNSARNRRWRFDQKATTTHGLPRYRAWRPPFPGCAQPCPQRMWRTVVDARRGAP